MAERFTLITQLRDKIYSTHLTVLQKLAKLCQESVKAELLTRIEELKLIEDFLEGTAKEEDDGVEKLSNVWVALLKLDTTPSTPVPTPSWKKELKISGQIGDPKSQLSFVSLVRQIETAVIKNTLKLK